MLHRLRFKQLGAGQPPEPALRQRRPAGIQVPRDGLPVGRADAPRIRSEALVADRAQVLGVRIEQVLAADLARGVEERDAHAQRDLEERALLAVGLGEQALVDRGELGGSGEALRVGAQVGERLLEPFDLERRDVDQARSRPARALQGGEQVVDRGELGLSREHARRLELADERIEVDARAVRDVGRGREEPERREAEGENRPQLDDVSARLAHGELLRRRLVLVGDGLGLALDSADELDRDAEEVLRRRLVEAGLPDESREDELGGLVDRPAERRRDRAEDPLGQRDQVLRRSAQALALGGLRADRDAAERGEAVEPERRCVVGRAASARS